LDNTSLAVKDLPVVKDDQKLVKMLLRPITSADVGFITCARNIGDDIAGDTSMPLGFQVIPFLCCYNISLGVRKFCDYNLHTCMAWHKPPELECRNPLSDYLIPLMIVDLHLMNYRRSRDLPPRRQPAGITV
jgi:hypothetical protein